MQIMERAALPVCPWWMLRWLAVLLACALRLAGQSSAVPATNAPAVTPVPGVHAVLDLDGPWHFQAGDDPRWADPAFDDSKWPTVNLTEPLTSQGVDSYSGYAWYRIRVQPAQLSAITDLSPNTPLVLFAAPNSVGQLAVYVNGVESGHTRGMAESPSMFQSLPLTVPFSSSGGTVVAIRTWAGSGVEIGRGLLDRVELGTDDDIAKKLAAATNRQWDEHAISAMVVTFLFACVAFLQALFI
jgi:hypothetical protein